MWLPGLQSDMVVCITGSKLAAWPNRTREWGRLKHTVGPTSTQTSHCRSDCHLERIGMGKWYAELY